ncbi:hypothetical protein BRARA_A00989 [Brassica rapa]|uniref:F-box domain-containing protein n=1 Tax=Brassica campestris TaxID=3711 RepID=A0A398AKG1_BRACM|nr:hypothetical protein BRARA_A00989 [Brassica rapa]
MISDLPHDLEIEILARVPTKSLAKLHTTCKRWYALFKDPKFVMKNNNLRKSSSKEVMLLLDYRVYSISVDRVHNSIDASMEFTGRLKRLQDSKDVKLSRIWHCNGLVLCCRKDIKSLVVWNPCTGETRSIKPSKFYRRTDNYAFGCGNSSCHDYKILRCSSYGTNCVDFHQVVQVVLNFEMYEFSTDSWRVLDGVTDRWRLHCSDDVVSLKGNAYWIHFDKEADDGPWIVLLSFNFTTEVFVSLPLPDYKKGCVYGDLLISVVREEHLAVLHHVVGTEMTVWLSNKITEAKEVSWSKFLVVSFDILKLPLYSREMTFWVDVENKVLVSCVRDMEGGGDHFYILGEGLHKQVYEVTEASWIWPCLMGYVPSLCHIPKEKRRRKPNRAHNQGIRRRNIING